MTFFRYLATQLKLIICFFLIISTIISYSQIKNLNFINYDDNAYVVENSNIQQSITIKSLIWAFTTFHAANWHPVTWLSHMLDYFLYGLHPSGHHLTNLLLHLVNTILIFLILAKMTNALWQSAFVSAMFALHPLHVESVIWVAERKDVLCTFFGLLTIIFYLRYIKAPNIKSYLLVFLFLCIGLMTKPMLVTLPFVLLLLDYWPLMRFSKIKKNMISKTKTFGFTNPNIYHLIIEKIPFLMPVIVASIMTFLAQDKGKAVQSLDSFPLINRIANALISYASYIVKAVWPQNLSVFYPYPNDAYLFTTSITYAFLFGIAFLFAIRFKKKYPYILFGFLFYFITLIPVIGIVQAGSQAMADRYSYIPLTGFFIIVCWGIFDFFAKWRYKKIIIASLFIIILSALSIRTFFQTMYWKDSITLFEHAINITDRNHLAHFNLAAACFDKNQFDKALIHYNIALNIKPDDPYASCSLGALYQKKKEYDNALFCYKKAVAIIPEFAAAYKAMGDLFFALHKNKKAIVHYSKAVQINFSDSSAYNNIANAYVRMQNYNKAIVHYKKALQINSSDLFAHNNIANVYVILHNYNKAIFHYNKAIFINPNYADAHFNFGLLYIKKEKYDKGLVHIKKASTIKPDYKAAFNKIKRAHAKSINLKK